MAENVNHSALKQWPLFENESLITFESWRSNLVYRLNSEPRFAIFLLEGVEWRKVSRVPGDTRDLVSNLLPGNHEENLNDPDPNGFTAAQKVRNLDLMLQQIANFCPVISRRTILPRIGEGTQLTFQKSDLKMLNSKPYNSKSHFNCLYC